MTDSLANRGKLSTPLILFVGLVLVLSLSCADAPSEPEAGDPPAGDEPMEVESEKAPSLPIVDRAIEFHGGDLYEASTTALTVTSRSGSFDLLVARNGGEYDYTVTGMVGSDPKVERKVHQTNESVSRWDDGVPAELDEDDAQRARDFVNARIYFPFLPYGLNGGQVYKDDLGLETWDGRSLHKVRVTFQPGTSTDAEDRYMYWFDPETGEVVMLAYDFQVGNGGLRLRKVIGTQRVGGLLFSDQENFAINGTEFSVDDLTAQFVAEHMELLSTIELSNIEVTASGS